MSLTILHAIPSLVGGGAERQLAQLAPELCRLGVNTHVAYVHPGVNMGPLLASPVRLHPISCRGNHDPRIVLKLRQIIRDIRPVLVHTWLTQMDVFAGTAALLTGTPFVLSERCSAAAYADGWKNRLRWLMGQHAAAIVANSQGGLQYWGTRRGVRRIIRNGLSLETIRSAAPASPDALGLPVDARIVLFAGRLSPQKNVATLLQAFELVLDRHSDCVAALFGDGPLREPLRAQIATMGARERVRIMGFTPELWRWMRRASVFVSPSLFEGSPNVVLEAMAIGCPVVVSNIAEHREILDDQTAGFCDPTSAMDIARAINAVLDNPTLAAARAAAAVEVSSQWSIEGAARAYLDLYRELSQRRLPTEGPCLS
jgi:glycosyltransferase involved in cell wall biosynthesis